MTTDEAAEMAALRALLTRLHAVSAGRIELNSFDVMLIDKVAATFIQRSTTPTGGIPIIPDGHSHVRCIHGCADAVMVVYVPRGCNCRSEPIQAVCEQHWNTMDSNGPIQVIAYLATPDGRFAQPPAPPTGEMVMVPREPTDEMMNAGFKAISKAIGYWGIKVIWRAMLASSPHPTPEEEGTQPKARPHGPGKGPYGADESDLYNAERIAEIINDYRRDIDGARSGEYITPKKRAIYDLIRSVEARDDYIADLIANGPPSPTPDAIRRAAIEWQLIETAPKDGTSIMCANNLEGNGVVAECYWSLCTQKYSECNGTDGWINRNGSSFAATHWQPKPAPPPRSLSPQETKEG